MLSFGFVISPDLLLFRSLINCLWISEIFFHVGFFFLMSVWLLMSSILFPLLWTLSEPSISLFWGNCWRIVRK